METTFGTLLKSWRELRRMSQLELGLSANVSARHISFIETGRARPSRSMVLQLSETLEVPRDSRNALLNAAGFSPAYARRSLNDADMKHVSAALDWTMQRHAPFPALALDRHWRLVRVNEPAARLLAGAGSGPGDSLIEALAVSPALRAVLDNWEEVVQHVVARLRIESTHLGGDPILDDAAGKLAAAIAGAPPVLTGPLPAVVPTRFRISDQVLSFFSTIAQFGTAEDIMLADLRLELLFPADDATRAILLAAERE